MGESGRDAKFFQRGKAGELRAELQADGKDKGWVKKKAALKKVIANATMGNDMSSLFPDMVNCMNIQVLDIKKMVYLYLINYGRIRQDLIHTTIPGFSSDCNDRNPLIRALAIRTMSSIQVPLLISSLIDPLRQSLKDADPYVRKTAAICVAKVYMYDRRLIDKHGFIGMLRDLLADSNPTVVANAVAALTEISERSDNIQLKLNLTVASKLVSALGECSEWGQTYILESLLFFVPSDFADAEILAERVAVRLSHNNSAVVLTAAKVILYLMNYISSSEFKEGLCKKLSGPLVSLLSSGPEVQYVALRNILLIIQRRPIVLRNEVKVFFCKYNDPIYVKMAKLEIMYRLATEKNVSQVLAELREYASEVDVDFVRKAVRSIGRLAIKIDSAADRCISTLVQLIQTKVNYVVQEAVVVIKDIFRKYPNRYESVIVVLCENLDSLDQSEAKAAMIWIIGQYADRIENSDELLEDFLYSFLEEPVEVQLALLTATVKLFLKKPAVGGELVPKVLKWATEEVDNPDCRDRGFMYWRLLSTDPAAARDIVLAEKPPISTETDRMDRVLLDQLLLHASTLSSIFHRQPQTFIRNAKARYMPDSPALDEGARRYASTHIYSRPIARGQSVPKPANASSSNLAESGPGLSPALASTANGAPPASPGGTSAETSELRKSGLPAAAENGGEMTPPPPHHDSADTSQDADPNGPPSPAESGIDAVAHARHTPTPKLDSHRNGGGEQQADPYAMLGDSFGEGGGYEADHPKPRSGLDDLLL